jgi:outer membrane protein assembly factor BamA
LAALLTLSHLSALAQIEAPSRPEDTAPARTLHLAEVQLVGATRTPLSTVYRYLELQPGQPVEQGGLVAAVEALRSANLFSAVTFYTRPGAERGQLVLVLEVQEHRLDFRWGVGNTDLDGWYLAPAMVAYDNAFGHGGFADLQWRIGLRHSGLLLRYGQPRAGNGRDFWSTSLSVMDTERPYFSEGVEYRHNVGVSGLAGVWGRRLGGPHLLELGLKLESVDVAPQATAYNNSPDGMITSQQDIPAGGLPPTVSAAIGRDNRAIFHLDWQYDTRAKEQRAGTPVSGVWGRLKGQALAQGGRSHGGLQADLRVFHEVAGGVLAGRLRGAWVGEQAAFYDRLYLGGMHSVRGFSTHALSPPGGDTWLCSGSLEYRSRILGDARGTKLAGLFFIDAGASGATDAVDTYHGVAASIGYGARLRVPWLAWIGLDVGFPLTNRPLDQRFAATASIGWSF